MKVKDFMSVSVACCGPRTNGASLAEIFWSKDAGSIPIVDEKGRILGVVTDRDLTIALGTRNQRPSDLTAEHVMSRDVIVCAPEDDVEQALELMQHHAVRRLPVVERDGTVRGIVSIDDLVRCAAKDDSDLAPADVVRALARIVDRNQAKATSLVATA